LWLLLLFGFILDCHITSQQVISEKNPMPYEMKYSLLDPRNSFMTTLDRGTFRDASVHLGKKNSAIMTNHQMGLYVLAIKRISAAPNRDLLNANLSNWDMQTHELVEFEAEHSTCAIGMNILVPVGQKNNKQVVPVRFSFTANSFYDDLKKRMEENRIEALLDAKIDHEVKSFLFIFIGRDCLKFRALGIRKKK